MITVYTAGVFDLLHIGHLRLLQRASELGDRLIVGVSTDELAREYKKLTPTVPYEERAALVAALRCVDEVVPQEDRNKTLAWRQLRFNVWVVGNDWEGHPVYKSMEAELSANGVRCVYLPYTDGVSSTQRRGTVNGG